MGGHIFNIATRTIHRFGTISILIMAVGFYFLFPACTSFRAFYQERNTPYELSVLATAANIDLDDIMQEKGVLNITPRVKISAILSKGKYTFNCTIDAVNSSFLNVALTNGTLFPDSTNMPYLILNSAAANSFMYENQINTVSCGDTLTMTVGNSVGKATVCGIIDDGKDSPTIYMSFAVAQKNYIQNTPVELVLLLKNRGMVNDISSKLQQYGIYPTVNAYQSDNSKPRIEQGIYYVCTSLCLFASAVALIREKRLSEVTRSESETNMLLLYGFTKKKLKTIYMLRVFQTVGICILIAVAGCFLTDCFSLLGLITIFSSACVVCISLVIEKVKVK